MSTYFKRCPSEDGTDAPEWVVIVDDQELGIVRSKRGAVKMANMFKQERRAEMASYYERIEDEENGVGFRASVDGQQLGVFREEDDAVRAVIRYMRTGSTLPKEQLDAYCPGPEHSEED